MDGNSVTVDEISRVKVLHEYCCNVHKLNGRFREELGLALRPSYIDDLKITEGAVRVYTGNVSVSKWTSPDKINPDIIKPLADLPARPNCKLYTVTLQKRYSHWNWKTAVVLARWKGGSKTEVRNCKLTN